MTTTKPLLKDAELKSTIEALRLYLNTELSTEERIAASNAHSVLQLIWRRGW